MTDDETLIEAVREIIQKDVEATHDGPLRLHGPTPEECKRIDDYKQYNEILKSTDLSLIEELEETEQLVVAIPMKIYSAVYNWKPEHQTYGGYHIEYYTIIAKDLTDALTQAKTAIKTSKDEEWSFEEIPFVEGATYITEDTD